MITVPTDLTQVPDDARCQEASTFSMTDYIACARPAVAIIQHNGRSEGPYYMCGPCAHHNIRHRDARAVCVKPGEEKMDAVNPLTQVELDEVPCMTPSCTHDECLFTLSPQCHNEAPVWVLYNKRRGRLLLTCSVCRRLVTEVMVAE